MTVRTDFQAREAAVHMRTYVEGDRVRVLKQVSSSVGSGAIGVVCGLYDGTAYEVSFQSRLGASVDILLTPEEIEPAPEGSGPDNRSGRQPHRDA